MIYVEIRKEDELVEFIKNILDGNEEAIETSTKLCTFVDSIPEVDKTKLMDSEGHPCGAILKYSILNKEFYYEYSRRPRRPEESVRILESEVGTLKSENETLKRTVGLMSAVDYYNSLDVSTEDLEILRQAKINSLKEQCEKTITEGFTSPTTGAFYAFSPTDQMNFTQQMILTMNQSMNGTPENVMWKTEDQGLIEHTPTEFSSVVTEAEQHKRQTINKYWNLKATVIGAQTNAEVDKVTWDGDFVV